MESDHPRAPALEVPTQAPQIDEITPVIDGASAHSQASRADNAEMAPEAYTPVAVLDEKEVRWAYDFDGELGPRKKILGLEKKIFWILLAVIIALITVAAVGGGVGGSVASNKSGKTTTILVTSSSATQTLKPTPTMTNSSSSNVATFELEATGTATVKTTSATSAPAPDSNFVAVNWDKNFMVFYQDNSKNIRMVESNLTINTNIHSYAWSRSNLLPLTVRRASSIAAVNCIKTSREVRLYAFSDQDIIQECAWSVEVGEWTVRNLNGTNIKGSSNSQIAAVRTTSSTIRVFYQNTDNKLAGMVFTSNTGVWLTATKFTNTTDADWPLLNSQGSGLFAVNFPITSPQGIRVYYQDSSGKLTWFEGKSVDTPDESWSIGPTMETIPEKASLTGTVAVNEVDRQLQLFYIRNGNLVADLWGTAGILTSPTSPYLGSNGLGVDGPGVAAISFHEIVLVIYGSSRGWFKIWQYTAWNGTWRNLEIPTEYFEG